MNTSQELFNQEYNAYGIFQNSSVVLTTSTPNLDSLIPNIVTSSTSTSSISSGQMNAQASLAGGYIQSSNFKTGSTGWQIKSNGDVEFGSGFFRGDITGSSGTFSGNLSGATITGGIIQTSATGKRIVISSNVEEFYNSANTNIASFNGGNLGANAFISITSPSSAVFHPIDVEQDGDDTQGAVNVHCLSATTGAIGVQIEQESNQAALYIKSFSTSANNAIYAEHNASNQDLMFLTQVNNSSGHVALLNHHGGNSTGDVLELKGEGFNRGLYVNLTSTSSSSVNPGIEVKHAGKGRGAFIHLDNSTNNNLGLYVSHGGTGISGLFENTSSSSTNPVLQTSQNSVTSTNFRKHISLDGIIMWISNGTTPNGNLSGGSGDICLNGTGGHMFWCSGGTTWTQI